MARDWSGDGTEETLPADGSFVVSLRVTNTGDRAGAEVVQLYVGHRESDADRPPEELAGFEKVRLSPGQEHDVTFELDADALAVYDGGWTVEPGRFDVLVGSSSRDIRLEDSLELVE